MELTVPTSLDEIKLWQVQKFWTTEANENITQEMKILHGVSVFTGKSIEELAPVKMGDIKKVYKEIAELTLPESRHGEDPLQLYFTYAGVEYGFEPDLRQIETSAFVDLDGYVKDINKNLHKIMAVLYRPVVSKTKKLYLIKSYTKEATWSVDHRQKIFLREMPYSYVRGAVNFFLEAVKKHTNNLSSSDTLREKPTQSSNPGDGSTLSTGSQKGTSRKAKKSSENQSQKL